MHIAIFGLTVSSSWGNGHATLWRSLIKALLRRGHTVSFYERNRPFYENARDLHQLPQGARLVVYDDFDSIRREAERDCDRAGLAMYTSYCSDGRAASELILNSRAEISCFYDMDTPVTLQALGTTGVVDYLPEDGLGAFDLVLSYTGGRALSELRDRLGARRTAPLYGSVDPKLHSPVPSQERLRAALSYLGTYAADRQEALRTLFVRPAERLGEERFLLGGAQYASDLCLPNNVTLLSHVPPPEHPAFFCSSRATLNVTRGVMAQYGYCPQGRLFEAAACGVPMLSDSWEGLATFFSPGRELLVVRSTEDVLQSLSLSDSELRSIADAARERTLAEHTGDCRVAELERLCDSVSESVPEHPSHAAYEI